MCNQGGIYYGVGNTATFIMPSGGIENNEIIIRGRSKSNYAVISGAIRYIPGEELFEWYPSQNGYNEWYLQSYGGGNPNLNEVFMFAMGASGNTMPEGVSPGFLCDGEWSFGNNDSLGYSTLYLRNDSGDPSENPLNAEGTYTVFPSFSYFHLPRASTEQFTRM